MWRNYLTVTLRLLAHNRAYAAINIGGLALGLAGCLLILNYVRYESSYDSWLPGSERVYQVQTVARAPGQPPAHLQVSPFTLQDSLPVSFPQVEAITSLTGGKSVTAERRSAFGFRAPQAAIGRTVRVSLGGAEMIPATIVGVVEDSRFRSARDPMEAMVYAYQPEQTNQVLVRYAAARPGDVMAALNKVWRRFEPEIPFEARFVDDIVRELYAAERARGALFAGFSGLAVLIAALGLYSLASFATERRTREIGIRKVLGAKVRDIVRLLAWQFSKPVVLANLIAWPAAWWAMRDWLNSFDIRIALTPGPFVVAGLLALAIAVATVAGHALRAARANPIHALRYE